jgi:hypothetical protein
VTRENFIAEKAKVIAMIRQSWKRMVGSMSDRDLEANLKLNRDSPDPKFLGTLGMILCAEIISIIEEELSRRRATP